VSLTLVGPDGSDLLNPSTTGFIKAENIKVYHDDNSKHRTTELRINPLVASGRKYTLDTWGDSILGKTTTTLRSME
jgi:hypothetical protein